ncbi:MAG: GxxExxY protein [Muribaculaceae bacterium]|nr:GxxExxY protein [Muribaculaceae bacterium]
MTTEEYNRLTDLIINTSIKVHRKLGPGLLETIYRKALAYELGKIGVKANQEVPIKCVYENQDLGLAFRADIIVEDAIILELKSTEENHQVYYKQLTSYLKVADKRLGLLINFGYPVVTQGIKRIVNNF